MDIRKKLLAPLCAVIALVGSMLFANVAIAESHGSIMPVDMSRDAVLAAIEEKTPEVDAMILAMNDSRAKVLAEFKDKSVQKLSNPRYAELRQDYVDKLQALAKHTDQSQLAHWFGLGLDHTDAPFALAIVTNYLPLLPDDMVDTDNMLRTMRGFVTDALADAKAKGIDLTEVAWDHTNPLHEQYIHASMEWAIAMVKNMEDRGIDYKKHAPQLAALLEMTGSCINPS